MRRTLPMLARTWRVAEGDIRCMAEARTVRRPPPAVTFEAAIIDAAGVVAGGKLRRVLEANSGSRSA